MNDHIPDPTKMISDTPRMKAAQMAAMEHMTGDVYRIGCELELELNAAHVEIERLKKSNLQLREGAEEQKQRIKRLEEGGDKAILNSYLPDRLAVWNKAKEAKL